MSPKKKKIIIISAIAIVLIIIICAVIIIANKKDEYVEKFSVYFTQENTIKSSKVNVKGTAKTQDATLELAEMSEAGEKEYAVLEIKKEHTDPRTFEKVYVEIQPGGFDRDYFFVSAIMCDQSGNTTYTQDQSISSDEIAYVKVTVELVSTLESPQKPKVDLKLIATPVE